MPNPHTFTGDPKMVLLQRPIEIIDQQVMSIKEILVFPMGKEVIC